jgi:hypothetical protein
MLETAKLLEQVKASQLPQDAKADLEHELKIKTAQFNTALAEALGLEVTVVRTASGKSEDLPLSVSETPQSAVPGQSFFVRIHATAAVPEAKLVRTSITTPEGEDWKTERQGEASVAKTDTIFRITVPAQVRPTEAYFSRPSIEQPYYDIQNPRWRNTALAPYPVNGWAEFDYNGATIRLGEVAQTVHRIQGPGSIFEPLLITPTLGISLSPEGSAVPLGEKSYSIKANVHG